MPPRLVVIADKEFFNLESIIWQINNNPQDLDLVGIVTPFNDIDQDIIRLVEQYKNMKSEGQIIPMIDTEESLDDYSKRMPDLQFLSQNVETRYLHIPYKPKMSDEQRKEYGELLLREIRPLQPDLIFLSNFKAILDENFVNAYSGRIVNVHPSMLPYNKGWRPEKMALEKNMPHASGYTFHVVVPGVDDGPTLFQQRVPIEGHDEKSLRLATILAQSRYVPRVLSLYASGSESSIVRAKVALDYENREIGDLDVNDYIRMLFKENGEFKTMESIFGSPSLVEERQVSEIKRYVFEIPFDGNGSFLRINDLFGNLPIIDQRLQHVHRTSGILDHRGRNFTKSLLHCEFRVMTPEIESILYQNGIDFQMDKYPVAVNAPRRKGFFVYDP